MGESHVNTRIPMLSDHTVQDRVERRSSSDPSSGRQRRKVNLSIDTAQAPAPTPGTSQAKVEVTAAGSLRGDGLSVGMAGLRIHNSRDAPSGANPCLDSWQPAARSSSSRGEAGNTAGCSAAASTAAADEEGRLSLVELQVESDLGSGTSGFVQLVRHKRTSQLFAMKVIALGCTEQERRQILIELRTLHKSDVPGIISFMDAFYADHAVHIVLEYMDRGSLAAVLRDRGPLPEWVLACVSSSVLSGLTHLHQQLKVVHRDIKPSNVLVNSNGDIKLADFGMSGQLASTFSRLASWVGTAAYMSPERISGSEYSYESDIWSLGVSLWELAVGRFPFIPDEQDGAAQITQPPNLLSENGLLPEEQRLGISFWELLHYIVERDPPPLPTHMGFSAAFSDVVTQCLSRLGADRPTAAMLKEHEWVLSERKCDRIAEWLGS